ncbi:hypothetical protein ASPVEDRAFT_31524 [Aspergillus versicolor CBS 583.65]|uniref:Uncharacterized protein n=1 Tax=Aspergillus versicolor CBS 583.65 TaxID=1036611 RepID=A0A1L9PUB9_ASPVE|nr:uncharacterized protein ASPVEDRAFT_31524 [Aspergillus versicolor CBS 583.65]OJJ05111.1 hypothetical protein ASPVEDRAFT_31524 [Aspergillus versicolor CBS 583.65]
MSRKGDMDAKLATATVPVSLADRTMEILDDFQRYGMIGSNPIFQGQHADASWCPDLGSWVMPDDGTGCSQIADAVIIHWKVFNEAWKQSRNVTKKASRDPVPSFALEQPPFATVNPQQLILCSSLSIAEQRHHSDNARQSLNSDMLRPNKAVNSPRGSNKTSPSIKPAAAPASNPKSPERTVRKAVGPRNQPITTKPDLVQKNIMLVPMSSWQNGSAARGQASGLDSMARGQVARRVATPAKHHAGQNIGPSTVHKLRGSTSASISAEVVARHVFPAGGEQNSQRPPQPIGPECVFKPGDHERGFVTAVRTSSNEIRRLR